jgi:gamma-glutamyltranspeptidase/glutathione hydrolase
VVAADNHEASRVGASVLAQGGNAVDAAIATALALGVVHPASSGIGGGGFAVVYIASEKKLYAFDFREVGPQKIKPELFAPSGTVDPELSRSTGLAVGVPGEIAGLDLLSRRFGSLQWRDLVRPAAGLARNGFQLTNFLHHAVSLWLLRAKKRTLLAKVLGPVSKRRPGTPLVRPKLARTLDLIAAKRSAGFYRGEVARDIVATVKAGGGVMELTDLQRYRPRELAPLIGTWGKYRVATMPLPSSGGIAVLEALGILHATGTDLAKLGAGSSGYIHLLAEALKHAFADRARFLGDREPEAVTTQLLAPGRLRKLAHRISKRRTLSSDRYGDATLGKAAGVRDDSGTSHLCVVDAQGNAVALTTTVNTYFGSGLLTPRSGIVLNDEMDDFALAPNQPNAFGLVQSSYNLVGPGKRPLSSMTPTLLLEGDRVVGCVGGSGGPRIISNTLQAMINVFVFGMNVAEALAATRIHHQWKPDRLVIEADMVRDVRTALKRRGHNLRVSPYATAVQMIVVDDRGVRSAASDPRKGGHPAAQ